jgi:hypothetical protein
MVTVRDYVKQRHSLRRTFHKPIEEQLENADVFEDEYPFFYFTEESDSGVTHFEVRVILGYYKDYEWYVKNEN